VVSQARVVLVLVELVFSILWSGLCFALQWGSRRGKRLILWLTSLPWMRNIGCGIRLRIVSFRGLGLGVFIFSASRKDLVKSSPGDFNASSTESTSQIAP
jgi:hypothetical protein